MAGIELRKEVAEKVTSVGFGAVVPLIVRAPRENNHNKPYNEERGWYNRLFIDVVRAGSGVTVGACFRSLFDGITDNVKIVNVELAKNGSMRYLMEDGIADRLMRIKPTGGALSFCFPDIRLWLRNENGLAVFQFGGLRVPKNALNLVREDPKQSGLFEFSTMTAGQATLLRLQDLVSMKGMVVSEAKPQPRPAASRSLARA